MRLSGFILLILISGFLTAQNLVPNYSFESYSSCPTGWSQLSVCASWMDWRTTPDYFNSCNGGTVSTPNNGRGSQAPSDGVAYVSVTTYVPSNPNYREILGIQLSSPLVIGTTYNLSMKVSVSDDYGWASDIGMQFFNSSYTTASPAPLNNIFHLASAAPITDKTNWVIISGTYVATAAYSYLGVGNFKDDANTASINLGTGTGAAHYYIDEIVVEPITSNPTITVNNPTICSGQSTSLTASSNITGTTFLWSTGGTGSTITVSPTTTTSYTVTGTAPSGGTGTATATVTVNPSPTVTASASPSSICSGQNSTLTAGGASTYSWSTGGSGSSIVVNPTSSSSYTVTGTSAAGCTNTASLSVTVNPSPTVLVSNQTICAGQSATLTASGAAIYSWNTGGTNSSITVSPTNTTVYTVTGTNAVGCTGTASATVTVNPLPTIGISASPASVCPGNPSTLTASGGSTYSWSTGGTGTTANVSPTTTTSYSVTGASAAGCTNTASISVTVLPGPVVTATGATICDGETANITASGAINYSWDNSMTGSSINVSPTSTTTYTVSGTDGSGCTGVATAVVTVNPLPSITTTDDDICSGQTATITASGGTSYSWSSGGTASSENVSPVSTNTYTVTGTDANGCENTATATVTVNPSPTITTTSTPDYCDSENGTATATPTGGSTPYIYAWNTSPAQTSNPAIDLPAGTYTVTVTDDNGCISTANATVSSIPGFTLTSNSDPEHCDQMDGSAEVIVSGATNPLSYSWSHNAGLNSNIANGLSSGSYTITVDDGQCVRTIDIDVSSINGPIAGFMLNPSTVTLDDPTVNIIDNSFGAMNWYYDLDDGNTSILPSFTYSYAHEGEYLIMQIVSDNFGCLDTAYQTLVVNESFAIYIPNAFSPNGDGRNDYFHPYGIGIDADTWNMRIYDRWGHTVFVTTDFNKAWNGNYNGDVNECSQGVYSYHITFKTTTGKDKEFFGRVTKLP